MIRHRAQQAKEQSPPFEKHKKEKKRAGAAG
jgi:hypothetical protein